MNFVFVLGWRPTQEFGGKEIPRKEGKCCYVTYIYVQLFLTSLLKYCQNLTDLMCKNMSKFLRFILFMYRISVHTSQRTRIVSVTKTV